MKKIALFLFIVFSMISFAVPEFDGFVDSERSVRIENENDYIISRTRLRLNTRADGEIFSTFASLNAIVNDITKEDEIKLHEAYIDYYGEDWEFRVGRQINTWGKADGVRITDTLNPVDLSDFIIRDFDDMRMPVNMLKIKKIGESYDMEVIWILEFKPAIAPSGKWSAGNSDVIPEFDLPEDKVENSEIGTRVSFYLPGADVSLYSFYTWNDQLVMKKKGDIILGEFKRDKFVGADIAATIGQFVVRGESVYYMNRYFSENGYEGDYYKKDLLKILAGVDWNTGDSLTITAQIGSDIVINHDKNMIQEKETPIVTLNISKKLINETLEISNLIYAETDKDSLYNKLDIKYDVADGLEVSGGVDIFAGNEGTFGIYNDNSQIRGKVKYSF